MVHRAEHALIEHVSQDKGFKVIPVVQNDPIEKKYYSEHPEATNTMSPDRFNAQAVITAADFLSTGGKVLVMTAQGTRDPQAKLSRAHPGLEYTLKHARRNTFAMPLALIPNARKNVPVLGKVTVLPGQLLSWEDLTDEYENLQRNALGRNKELRITRSDLMMIHLARLLPERNQGVYRNLVKSVQLDIPIGFVYRLIYYRGMEVLNRSPYSPRPL